MGNMTIEIIRNDLMAFHFEDAYDLGIEISDDANYEKFKNQNWALSRDGKLYLNKSQKGYKSLLGVFSKLADTPTEEIESIYDELCFYYPDDNDFKDMCKYTEDLHIKNVALKVVIPTELKKREQGKEIINNNIIRIFTKL